MPEIPSLADPFELFALWFGEARDELGDEAATSFALATANADALPSVRIVLLKDGRSEGFTFYTNLGSNKARDLQQNPRAAMCFHWAPFGRQVRIQGRVEQVSDREADTYFAGRPRDSQLGAWASRQSRPLANRKTLLDRVAAMSEDFGPGEIPRPEFWSGFRLIPDRYEFWSRGEYRLHDRRLYLPNGDGTWNQTILYP